MPALLTLILLCGPATPAVTPAEPVATRVASPVAPGAVPAASPASHPNSRSVSRIVVDGARVQLDLRCQVAGVLEVVDADTDLDLWLSGEELDAHRDAIATYLLDHFVLRTDSGGKAGGGRRLEGTLLAMALQEELGGLVPEQWVVSTFVFEDEAEVRDLLVEMTLFLLTSPDHRDVSQLVWHGEALPATVFWMGDHRRRFAPDAAAAEAAAAAAEADVDAAAAEAEVMAATAEAGAADAGSATTADGAAAGAAGVPSPPIRGLWLAWLLALAVGAPSLRSLVVAAVVAFGATACAVSFGPREADVSAGLAAWAPLAVVITALTTLVLRPRPRWPEALAFGALFGWLLPAVPTSTEGDPAAALTRGALVALVAAGVLASLAVASVMRERRATAGRDADTHDPSARDRVADHPSAAGATTPDTTTPDTTARSSAAGGFVATGARRLVGALAALYGLWQLAAMGLG